MVLFASFGRDCLDCAFAFPPRVAVNTGAASPNAPKPDHRSALANRPSRALTSGSAIAACSVLVRSSRTVDDGFLTSAASSAVRVSSFDEPVLLGRQLPDTVAVHRSVRGAQAVT